MDDAVGVQTTQEIASFRSGACVRVCVEILCEVWLPKVVYFVFPERTPDPQ